MSLSRELHLNIYLSSRPTPPIRSRRRTFQLQIWLFEPRTTAGRTVPDVSAWTGRETHPAKKTSPPPASFLDFCDSVCNPRLVLFYPSFPLPNPPTLLRTLGLSPLYLLYQPKVFVQLIASTTAACGSSPTPGATSRLQNPPTAVLPSPLI